MGLFLSLVLRDVLFQVGKVRLEGTKDLGIQFGFILGVLLHYRSAVRNLYST